MSQLTATQGLLGETELHGSTWSRFAKAGQLSKTDLIQDGVKEYWSLERSDMAKAPAVLLSNLERAKNEMKARSISETALGAVTSAPTEEDHALGEDSTAIFNTADDTPSPPSKRLKTDNIPVGPRNSVVHLHPVDSSRNLDSGPMSLDSFMNESPANVNLRNSKGSVKEFCRDQFASGRVIECFTRATLLERKEFVNELLASLVGIATNNYGNWVCLQLIECAPPAQLSQIVEVIASNMPVLAGHPIGSLVLKSALPLLSSVQIMNWLTNTDIAKEFINVPFISVMKKATQILAVEDLETFVNQLTTSLPQLARSKNSRLWLKRVLDKAIEFKHFDLSDTIEERLLSKLRELTCDAEGYHIINWILRNGSSDSVEEIRAALFKNFLYFSVHRFGSMVVRTWFETCSVRQLATGVDFLLSTSAGTDIVAFLAKNQSSAWALVNIISATRDEPRWEELLKRANDSCSVQRGMSLKHERACGRITQLYKKSTQNC